VTATALRARLERCRVVGGRAARALGGRAARSLRPAPGRPRVTRVPRSSAISRWHGGFGRLQRLGRRSR
jgi:hypothetical protein